MIRRPTGLDPARFISECWQRQWAHLPSAMPHVPELMEPDVLAGLACEDEVEARLIQRRADTWEVRHGPFDEAEFARLPDSGWTLLVQDVDSHLPETRSVLASFSFLPAWRLDDLMVSYAAPGGTVGPHIDDYDVFLLQGSGSRVWQIDPAPADLSYQSGLELRVLANFHAAETVVTRPGDLLYLPPGVAHYGVSDTASMTWSVGFRAPSAADLLVAAAEQLDCPDRPARYEDAGLAVGEIAGGRISVATADRIRSLLAMAMPMDDAQLLEMMGRAATRLKPWLRPDPSTDIMDARAVTDRLSRGHALLRHPASRLAWTELPDAVLLFADGAVWRLPHGLASFAAGLTDADCQDASRPAHTGTTEAGRVLADLVAQGTLYWRDDGRVDDRAEEEQR